jgi:hypothetical protein
MEVVKTLPTCLPLATLAAYMPVEVEGKEGSKAGAGCSACAAWQALKSAAMSAEVIEDKATDGCWGNVEF